VIELGARPNVEAGDGLDDIAPRGIEVSAE
jgi:hypothetical protein